MIPKDKTLVITVGIAYCNLGVQYESLGKIIESMNWYYKAYYIAKQGLGNIHPLTLKFYKNIDLLFERYEKSINLIDKRKNYRENSAINFKSDNGLPKLNDEK
jgi:hypothetical protein